MLGSHWSRTGAPILDGPGGGERGECAHAWRYRSPSSRWLCFIYYTGVTHAIRAGGTSQSIPHGRSVPLSGRRPGLGPGAKGWHGPTIRGRRDGRAGKAGSRAHSHPRHALARAARQHGAAMHSGIRSFAHLTVRDQLGPACPAMLSPSLWQCPDSTNATTTPEVTDNRRSLPQRHGERNSVRELDLLVASLR